jgi:hypothetical protein
MPTIPGSIQPSPQQRWPILSIHPQIPLPFTTRRHMTHPVTSMPMASTACHLAANTNKIWSQILPSIYAVMILLIMSTPEPQSTGRTPISLPSLPLPAQTVPKLEPSEGAIGLNPVKTEYGATASGQPFSPMTPLGSPSLTGDHAPYMKEEEQEPLHVGTSSMPRASTPLHGHSSLRHHRPHTFDSFRLVQDPAAYPGFAPSTKVRSCLKNSLLMLTHV